MSDFPFDLICAVAGGVLLAMVLVGYVIGSAVARMIGDRE